MSKVIQAKRIHHGEKGYALLIVVFFVALLAIAVATVSPNVLTQVRRDKEEEMIWRGKQYVRGIRLYYGKTHRFPTQLEDLYKPKTGIRFMRQAYKDPMNGEDGSWRLLYVGPNGQIIGSLKDRSVNMGGQPVNGFGGAAGGMSSSQQSGNSMFGSSNGFGSASSFGSSSSVGSNSGFGSSNSPNGPGANQAANAANGQTPGMPSTGDGDPSLQPTNLSNGPIIGGNIIGVGSKINKKSIIWYEKAKNYRQYEFVWDPSTDSLTGARPGLPANSGTQLLSPNGTPQNSPFSSGMNNNQNQTPTPTPTPTPPQNPGLNPDPNGNPPLQAPPNQ